MYQIYCLITFPAIIMPTRISSRSATLIDHMYYNEGKTANQINRGGNFFHDLTDHLPKYLLLINNKKIKKSEPRPNVRIFSEKNKQKFIQNVTQSNWSSVYNQSDANDACDKFA